MILADPKFANPAHSLRIHVHAVGGLKERRDDCLDNKKDAAADANDVDPALVRVLEEAGHGDERGKEREQESGERSDNPERIGARNEAEAIAR